MRPSSLNRFVRHAALIAIGISLAVTPSTSQVTGITLAWEASPDNVDGYLVHVGTSTGWYEQIFDAGRKTTFTYRFAEPGVEYFFVVTAYRSGKSSPRTAEVSGVLRKTPEPVGTRSHENGTMSSPAVGSRRESQVGVAVSASCPNAQGCYQVRLRAHGLQQVTSLASTSNGDLFVVEAGQRVRFVDAENALDSVTLESPERHRITDVAVGPDFASTRHLYVGVTHPDAGITQNFSIVRYRYVHGRMGEAAVIVAGLPVVNSQSPRMTIDRVGRIYVAMPAGDGTLRDPYAGMILRFNADGTTPEKARAASPILAAGFAIPTGLTADAESIWALGFDRSLSNAVGRLPLDEPPDTGAQALPELLSTDGGFTQSTGTRLISLGVSPEASQRQWLALIDTQPALHVGRFPAEPQFVRLQDANGDLLPDAVVVGSQGRIYVAARDGNDVTMILELRAQ